MLFHRAQVAEPDAPVGPAESLSGQAAEFQTQQEVRPGGEVQPEPKPRSRAQSEPETQSEPVGQAEPEAQQAPQEDPDPEIERPQPGTAQEVVPHA